VIVPLIDTIVMRAERGWLRCTTDLLSLSNAAQTRLMRGVCELRRKSSLDGRYHDILLSFAGMWVHPAVFVAVSQPTMGAPAAIARLSQYMRVKAYQLQSDRAYGLLLSTDGKPVHFIYQTNPPRSDPELDHLVIEIAITASLKNASLSTPFSASTRVKTARSYIERMVRDLAICTTRNQYTVIRAARAGAPGGRPVRECRAGAVRVGCERRCRRPLRQRERVYPSVFDCGAVVDGGGRTWYGSGHCLYEWAPNDFANSLQ